MMDLFREQASRFGAILKETIVDKVVLNQTGDFKIYSEGKLYIARTVIIATGATARFLDIPSEAAFKGKGVSACATCDGFFFKEKEVVVVGGGDSAMEEANFLTKFASKVTIVHRSDRFRASKIMFDRSNNNPKIDILKFRTIHEIYGDEKTGMVRGVKLQDTQTSNVSDFPIQGVFIAIGHIPNTRLFEGQIELDPQGYILTKKPSTSTNVAGVFAAGDVQDSYYRQAITAAGSGCMAAIDAERYLEQL